MVVVAVRDIKAYAYQSPHFAVSAGVASRGFADAAQDKQTVIGAHPEDFQLFKIGDFDERTGVITPCVVPELLCSAMDFINSEVK